MNVTELTYNRIAKGVGGLLTFMGLSLLGMYGVYMAADVNLLAAGLPGLDDFGFIFIGSLGAFALPIGGFLLRGGPDIAGRLHIAGAALGLLAVIRLIGFTSPDVRAVVGSAPLVEFFVLGGIALLALLVRTGGRHGVA